MLAIRKPASDGGNDSNNNWLFEGIRVGNWTLQAAFAKAATATSAVLMLLVATAGCAHAQNVFDQLFGGFWKSPTDHSVATARQARQTLVNRNYCVRLCDGYYWPIGSKAGNRRNNEACASSCSSPARFFRIPSSGQSAKDMVDSKGQNYSDLPTAFKYRKVYSPSCSCRPAPWSAEAKARHAGYAEAEKSNKPARAYAARRRPSIGLVTGSITSARHKRRRSFSRKNQTLSKKQQRSKAWMRSVLGN